MNNVLCTPPHTATTVDVTRSGKQNARKHDIVDLQIINNIMCFTAVISNTIFIHTLQRSKTLRKMVILRPGWPWRENPVPGTGLQYFWETFTRMTKFYFSFRILKPELRSQKISKLLTKAGNKQKRYSYKCLFCVRFLHEKCISYQIRIFKIFGPRENHPRPPIRDKS